MDTSVKQLIAAIADLNKQSATSPDVVKIAGFLDTHTNKMVGTTVSMEELKTHVSRLQKAASAPAKNYTRMLSITAGLNRAIELSKQPENAAIQPRIATLVNKVAGIFALCDTADELSAKSLEEIEAAVHRLYDGGAMNKPNTYNFEARGKGHRNKAE